MKANPIDILLLIIFLYPILKGFLLKYSSNNIKMEVENVNKNINFIIALFLGVNWGKKIFLQHERGVYRQIYMSISINIRNFIESKPFVIYILLIPLMCFVIFKILIWLINLINSITFYPILDWFERHLNGKRDFLKRLVGMIVEIPKSICYVLLTAFILNVVSIFNLIGVVNPYLQDSQSYRYICKQVIIPVTQSKLAKKLPNILDNSFKVVIRQADSKNISKDGANNATVVYYNGVTLDEGIKSNEEINDFSKKLVSKENTIENKAKILYAWIGKNISYDDNKALNVMSNNFNDESGAIPTFRTRKGICFDYSCLYVAMCRANGIKVRLITGQGFNGVSWVSHAWNEVYSPLKNEWINVDTTFYKGGNYFNSKRFSIDHRNSTIVGEW